MNATTDHDSAVRSDGENPDVPRNSEDGIPGRIPLSGNFNQTPDALLQALILASPDGIFSIDLSGRITFASPTLLRMFGLECEEQMLGTQAEDWVEENHRQRIRTHIVQALDGSLSADNIYLFRTRSGKALVGEVKAGLLRDASGQITGFMGILRDVTDRWEANEALIFSEARFRSVVHSNPVGMHFYHLFSNGQLVLEQANEAADRILRIDHAPLLGKTIEEAFPGLIETQIPAVYRRVAAEGAIWRDDQVNYERDEISGAFEVIAFQVAPGHMVAAFSDVTERKRAELGLRASLANMQLLRTIDKVIIEHNDVQTSLEALLQPVADFFHAGAAEILLYNEEQKNFLQVAGAGFLTELAYWEVPETVGMPGLALRERKPVGILDLREAIKTIGNAEFLTEEGFCSGYSALLATPNRVQGVLQLFYREETALTQSQIDFFEMISNQVAIAIEKTSLWENHQRALVELGQAYESTLEGWVMALDLRDNELEHHTRRVTELTIATANAMGIRGLELVNMRRGALLHDIGKIGIPDRILHKAGALSAEEWVQMRQHTVYARNMLHPIQYLHSAIDIPYCHHERWDGSGYPRGLKGKEIPLAARIFALADVWDALTSDRPYRRAWSRAETVAYIKDNAGILFDPEIVPVFLGVVELKSP